MSAKILISGTIVWAHNEIEQLKQFGEVVQLTSTSRQQFYEELQTKYAGIVAIYRHNDSASKIGFFDKELIEKLPSTVKFICHNGAGYDQIDVDAATARDIQVSHTPAAVDDATATTAMFLILSSLRQYWKAEVNARKGIFKQGLKPASDPEGKTIGIIGMGGIGGALAKRALGFDMKIKYHNRREIQPPPSFPCEYVSTLDELLATSDVISLNLPLNEKTANSFGKEQFNKMKDGAVLINTARGGVVEQEAFIEALKSGKLSSAGLDVYPDEPNIDQRLIDMPNISLLPHMGTETRETQHKMEVLVIDNIKSAISSGKLLNQVHEQKK